MNDLSAKDDSIKDIEKIYSKFKRFLFSVSLNIIYKNKPSLRNDILEFIRYTIHKNSDPKLISKTYKQLDKIIACDKSATETFLELTEYVLKTKKFDNFLLGQIVNLLTEIYDDPKYKNRAQTLMITAEKMAGDDLKTIRIVARKLGQWELLHSNIHIGQRINDPSKNNWENVNQIPVDKAAVLMLGGDGTRNPKAANGYARKIEHKLTSEGINDVAIYSVFYDFGDEQMGCNPKQARNIQMKQFGRKIQLDTEKTAENINSKYLKQLFDIVIRPRLEENGKRLPLQAAIQNIRKITFIAHCHGAYTFLKLEEMMQQRMSELGYTVAEKQQIQKQMLCIAHAPQCPLGASKSTMLSFASIKDPKLNSYNNFQVGLRKFDKKYLFSFAFFPEKYGNIFIAAQIFDMWFERDIVGLNVNPMEHTFIDYDNKDNLLTIEGDVMIRLSGNALVNAVKSSQNNTQITNVQNLVCDNKDDLIQTFEMLKKNGLRTYKDILKILRTR